MLGERALASVSDEVARVVEVAPVHLADEGFDFGGAIGKVALEPFEEEVFYLVGEAEHDPAGAGCAGGCRGIEEGGDLAIVDAGDDRRGHDGDGDSGARDFADGLKAVARAGGAGLHDRGEIVLEAGDADRDVDGAVLVQALEQVEIAQDEFVLGDDADGLAALGHHFEAAAGDAEFALDGLVAIGDAGHRDRFAPPAFFGEFAAEEFGRIVLGEDDGLEVEAARHAEVFVSGAGVAVDAAVLATPVGVDGPLHREVGGIDGVDEGFGAVGENARFDLFAAGGFGVHLIEVFAQDVEADGFEAVAGVDAGAAATGGTCGESVFEGVVVRGHEG